jgi:hypothetical protein
VTDQRLVYAPFYETYVSLVPEAELLPALAEQTVRLRELANGLTPALERYRYAEGKWSVREVFGHLLDGERVFGYRALCIARGEIQPLPGFDENRYVARSGYDRWPVASLLAEFGQVRDGHVAMFRRFDPEAWDRVGTAAGQPISVRALAAILVGHVRHHLGVLADRYGVGQATLGS